MRYLVFISVISFVFNIKVNAASSQEPINGCEDGYYFSSGVQSLPAPSLRFSIDVITFYLQSEGEEDRMLKGGKIEFTPEQVKKLFSETKGINPGESVGATLYVDQEKLSAFYPKKKLKYSQISDVLLNLSDCLSLWFSIIEGEQSLPLLSLNEFMVIRGKQIFSRGDDLLKRNHEVDPIIPEQILTDLEEDSSHMNSIYLFNLPILIGRYDSVMTEKAADILSCFSLVLHRTVPHTFRAKGCCDFPFSHRSIKRLFENYATRWTSTLLRLKKAQLSVS